MEAYKARNAVLDEAEVAARFGAEQPSSGELVGERVPHATTQPLDEYTEGGSAEDQLMQEAGDLEIIVAVPTATNTVAKRSVAVVDGDNGREGAFKKEDGIPADSEMDCSITAEQMAASTRSQRPSAPPANGYHVPGQFPNLEKC